LDVETSLFSVIAKRMNESKIYSKFPALWQSYDLKAEPSSYFINEKVTFPSMPSFIS
jgi:hypothetical protein